jgi:hypothetical protein
LMVNEKLSLTTTLITKLLTNPLARSQSTADSGDQSPASAPVHHTGRLSMAWRGSGVRVSSRRPRRGASGAGDPVVLPTARAMCTRTPSPVDSSSSRPRTFRAGRAPRLPQGPAAWRPLCSARWGVLAGRTAPHPRASSTSAAPVLAIRCL